MGRPVGMKKVNGKFVMPGKESKLKPVQTEEQPKATLEELRDKHLEEKNLADAEKESKHKKRKRMLAVEAEKQGEQLSGGLTLLGGALAEMLCARLPNPQPPTPVERELLGQALSQVALDYVPVMAQYASLVTLAAILAGIVLPRLKKDGNISDAKYKDIIPEKKEKSDESDKPGTESLVGDGQNRQRQNESDETSEATVEPLAHD
jgi:hypothetical protein